MGIWLAGAPGVLNEAPDEIGTEATEALDPRYTKALFEFGYRRTLGGNTWKNFETMIEQIGRIEVSEQ